MPVRASVWDSKKMDAGYYLLKGIQKTDGETALIFLGYNLVRVLNLLGFKKMMEIMAWEQRVLFMKQNEKRHAVFLCKKYGIWKEIVIKMQDKNRVFGQSMVAENEDQG